MGCFCSKLQFCGRVNTLKPEGDCVDAAQASDTLTGVVITEKQTPVTKVRQKLHSEELQEIRALLLASCFYSSDAEEYNLL